MAKQASTDAYANAMEALLPAWEPATLGLDLLVNLSTGGTDAAAETIDKTLRLFNAQADLFKVEKDKYEESSSSNEDDETETILAKHEKELINSVSDPRKRTIQEALSILMAAAQEAPDSAAYIRKVMSGVFDSIDELADDVIYTSAKSELPSTESKADSFEVLESARTAMQEMRESIDTAINLAKSYKVTLPKSVKFEAKGGKGGSVRQSLVIKRVPQLPGQRRKNRISASAVVSDQIQYTIDGNVVPIGSSLERIANTYLSSVANPVLAKDLLAALRGKSIPATFTINGHEVSVTKAGK